MINKKTEEIIKLLKSGKTQTEVANMGYPFGTVRYHYQKLFQPKKFERFMKQHKARMKKKWQEKKAQELSTPKPKNK